VFWETAEQISISLLEHITHLMRIKENLHVLNVMVLSIRDLGGWSTLLHLSSKYNIIRMDKFGLIILTIAYLTRR